MSKITSNDILKLLSEKHSEDVFVPECKNGSTWFSNHLRLDAWVMNRSWTKLKFTGYEVKVSRSDFLHDDKHQEYMKLCNEFYFVAPKGIINVDEIPVESGLLEIASTGTRLFTKKKAPFRSIDFPSDLFTYILMCRVRIKKDLDNDFSSVDYWTEWVNNKENKRNLGHLVSQKLQSDYKQNIERVENENSKLRDQNQKFDEFKTMLSDMGIDNLEDYWKVRNKIRDLKNDLDFTHLKKILTESKLNIEMLLNRIEV